MKLDTLSIGGFPLTAESARFLFPGLMAAGLVSLAAQFVADHHNAPAMLMALLFGIAMNFLGDNEKTAPGIGFCSRTLLRIGVAILGARISAELVIGLGWQIVSMIIAGVLLTIGAGYVAAKSVGKTNNFGILTGGAVAICGASAAMAISAALPQHKDGERDLLFTVFSVTAFSTIAMIVYPVLVEWLAFDDVTAGVFLGATIHDVAQVVGAGFTVSDETGDVATLVKLIRVSLLAPVVIAIAFYFRSNSSGQARPALIPAFVVGFVVLATVNSLGMIPSWLQGILSDVSRWALLTAIAAVGMKTSIAKLATVGWRSMGIVVGETVFLAILIAVALHFI